MVDLNEIASDGEDWEAFARDFLLAEGFVIETPPDRGPDGGKDMLVTEQLAGRYSSYLMRWLVSCKHLAGSGTAVSETHERNILERIKAFGADGFLGFYSTVPSSGLAERMRALRARNDIKDFKFFDSRLIENHIVRLGYSHLLMRYFPASYSRVKPLHRLLGEYIPLNCRSCGKDLLKDLRADRDDALIAIVRHPRKPEGGPTRIEDVYWACKGPCARSIERSVLAQGLVESWEDISDLVMPLWYLRWIVGHMNNLRDGDDVYTEDAFNHLKDFIMAIAQRVFREMTEEERQRTSRLSAIVRAGLYL